MSIKKQFTPYLYIFIDITVLLFYNLFIFLNYGEKMNIDNKIMKQFDLKKRGLQRIKLEDPKRYNEMRMLVMITLLGISEDDLKKLYDYGYNMNIINKQLLVAQSVENVFSVNNNNLSTWDTTKEQRELILARVENAVNRYCSRSGFSVYLTEPTDGFVGLFIIDRFRFDKKAYGMFEIGLIKTRAASHTQTLSTEELFDEIVKKFDNEVAGYKIIKPAEEEREFLLQWSVDKDNVIKSSSCLIPTKDGLFGQEEDSNCDSRIIVGSKEYPFPREPDALRMYFDVVEGLLSRPGGNKLKKQYEYLMEIFEASCKKEIDLIKDFSYPDILLDIGVEVWHFLDNLFMVYSDEIDFCYSTESIVFDFEKPISRRVFSDGKVYYVLLPQYRSSTNEKGEGELRVKTKVEISISDSQNGKV